MTHILLYTVYREKYWICSSISISFDIVVHLQNVKKKPHSYIKVETSDGLCICQDRAATVESVRVSSPGRVAGIVLAYLAGSG